MGDGESNMLKSIKFIENKKAFKTALKQMKNKNESKNNVSQIYGNGSRVEKAFASAQYSGAYAKPSSEVVDLKDFKNWRKIEKVESNNPVYNDDIFKSSLSRSEKNHNENSQKDEELEPNASPVSNFIGGKQNSQRKASNDFDSFFVDKQRVERKRRFTDEELEKAQNEFKKMIEDVEKKKREKQQRDAVAKAQANNVVEEIQEEPELKLPEVKVEVEPEKPTLKVVRREEEEKKPLKEKTIEIIQKSSGESSNSTEKKKPLILDITLEKKPNGSVQIVNKTESTSEKPRTVQKQTTRKPRGKNKRRFDADVIGSVDWR